MAVPEPHQINAAFAAAYNERDLAALERLYAPDGSVVNPNGAMAIGPQAIREHLSTLLAIGGEMTSVNQFSHINGELALIGAHWTIRFDDGRPDVDGHSSEVLRRDDVGWRYVIDAPR